MRLRAIAIGAAFVLSLVVPPSDALALSFDRNPERWRGGADVGLWGGAIDDDVRPALGVNLDYYVDRLWSVGPMMLFSTSGDLTEVALAGAVRYHYRTSLGNIVPFVGVGFVHASWEDRSSSSYFLPLGVSYEYQLTKKLAASITGMLNFHDLFPGNEDKKSGTLLFGLRYGGPAPRPRR